MAAVLLFGSGSLSVAEAVDVTPVWEKNCASCHGADGKADTKAGKLLKVRDLTAPDVRATFDRAAMIKATQDGVKNEKGKAVMKGFASKLSAEQIEALVDWIYALVPEAAAAAAAPAAAPPAE